MAYIEKNYQKVQKVSNAFILKAFKNVIKIEENEMLLLNSLKSSLYSKDIIFTLELERIQAKSKKHNK